MGHLPFQNCKQRSLYEVCLRLVAICSAVGLASCSSLTYRGRHEYVLIQSNPPGATIRDGHKMRGDTPAFVDLRRGHKKTLSLTLGNTTHKLNLKTHYRWGGSFASNLAFLYFAPVGWTVDWLTGAAWWYEDPPAVQFPNAKMTASASAAGRLAIAPPKASTSELSDEAGLLLEQQAPQLLSRSTIIPYRKSLPIFITNGYDFDSEPGEQGKRSIFAKLNTKHILESRVTEGGGQIQLHGKIKNVYSGKVEKTIDMKAAPTTAVGNEPWYEKNYDWIHFLPNTAAIEWSSSDTDLISTDGQLHQAVPARSSSFWSQVAPIFGAIDLTSLEPPRRNGTSFFSLTLVPSVRLSYRRIRFPDFIGITQEKFEYFQLSAGYGPELGWHWGPSYFYIRLIPLLGYHHLTWENPSSENEMSLLALTTTSEIGYLYFINRNISINLFVKTMTTPANMWNHAIQNIDPNALGVTNSNYGSAGISVGYTFEPRYNYRRWHLLSAR